MSGKINVACELRDQKILADTLVKMGLTASTEKDGRMTIKRPYMNMEIGIEKIDCDSMDRGMADNIKVQYQKNLQLNTLNIQGDMYEIVENSEKISIYVM
jgi:hypothetical protein